MPSRNDPERWRALTDGSGCPICIDGPRDVAAEMRASWVTVPPLAPLPGYVCIVGKTHAVEPFELPPAERAAFWDDVNRVAAAIHRELRPVKLNYEIHGNTLPHLHLHLFPRQPGDRFEGRPIDGADGLPRTDAEVARIRRALNNHAASCRLASAPMKVRGIVWMGVQTDQFDATATLFRSLFGASPSQQHDGFMLWSLGNGDIVELYSLGGKPTFGTAPVVGFQVEDLEAAKRDIEAAGAEIVGGYGPNEAGYQTIHFRAPDGNVYEITYDPDHETREPSG